MVCGEYGETTLFNTPDVEAELRGRRLQWLGHVHRMEPTRVAKQVWERRCQMRRDPLADQGDVGRTKQWRTYNVNQWKAVAEDRVRWRTVVQAAKSPTGLSAPP